MHLDDSWLLFWNPQWWKDPLRCTQSCLRPSPLLCLVCPYAHTFIYLLYLSVSFLGCSRCHPALFVEVLEKTVEGEAVALTKAKTLYKSCINDRKWAQVESWLVMLQVCPVVTKKKIQYMIWTVEFLLIGNFDWNGSNGFCLNTLGEIEKRGGTPLIEVLPDVYDWPIAVDNWEAKYGKASLCQRVPAQKNCAQAISSSQWPRRLFSSGKLWRLEDVIARLNVNYDSQLVINLYIGIDDKDSSSHIIHVGLGLWRVGKCLFPLSGECLLDALNNRQSSNLISAVWPAGKSRPPVSGPVRLHWLLWSGTLKTDGEIQL